MHYYFDNQIAYNVMVKPNGPICNLDCKYCYYLEKENLYPKTHSFRMPRSVLESFIKQYIESQSLPVIQFSWQGGEPMMAGIDFFKDVVSLQKYYGRGRKIMNAFQTNGTLISEEWCRFFKENNFLIGISIDGPREMHDKYRVRKNGAPTWMQVVEAINLLKKHGVEFNTLTVVNDFNAQHPAEVYHFLKDLGSSFHQYIPLVEVFPQQKPEEYPLDRVVPDFKGEKQVTPWSVKPQDFGKFLTGVFDEWLKQDVGRIFIQHFDSALANWVGEKPGLCVYNKTCGDAMVMEHNGDVYSCDHFVFPDYKLDNIRNKPLLSQVLSPQQRKFGNDKNSTLPEYCRQCDFLFACNGECPKNRIIKTPDGEDGLNYLCEGFKLFFAHIKPYMDFMANELRNKRSPANVMEWANR
jgi:uncharacterized protein